MSRRRFRAISSLAMFLGLAQPGADAGVLSMQFAGGANEVTLGLSESAIIEVLFQMNAVDKKSNRVTGLDARFDVGSLTDAGFGNYVVDGSTALSVTSAAAGDVANWNTAATSGVGGPFNAGFFLSAGDPSGATGLVGNGTNPSPVVIASFTIRRDAPSVGDIYAVFRVLDPLPAIYNGPIPWVRQEPGVIWEFPPGGGLFDIGRGHPGDANPIYPYHGYETLQPLVIHTVPEPDAFATGSPLIITIVASPALKGRSVMMARKSAPHT